MKLKKKRKLKRKYIARRLFLSVFMIFTIIIFTMLLTTDSYSIETNQYDYVTVKAGDTLWSIASEHNSANADIRELVYQTAMLNEIDDCIIYPGDTIKILKTK